MSGRGIKTPVKPERRPVCAMTAVPFRWQCWDAWHSSVAVSYTKSQRRSIFNRPVHAYQSHSDFIHLTHTIIPQMIDCSAAILPRTGHIQSTESADSACRSAECRAERLLLLHRLKGWSTTLNAGSMWVICTPVNLRGLYTSLSLLIVNCHWNSLHYSATYNVTSHCDNENWKRFQAFALNERSVQIGTVSKEGA